LGKKSREQGSRLKLTKRSVDLRPSSNRRAIEFLPTMASLLVSAKKIILFQRFEGFTSEMRTFASAAERDPRFEEKAVAYTFFDN
jgi:hypothetical protein